MKALKSKLIAVAAVIILAAIGSFMDSHRATAQAQPGSAPVTVVNTASNPVPVTGSTTISGTVAATQSGAWNVGITGTPSVNVTNPASAPVLFVNVNDPGRIPYQQNSNSISCRLIECTFSFSTVPSGHRLVIQHVSTLAESTLPSTGLATLSFSPGGNDFSYIPMTVIAGSPQVMIGDQPVLVFIDAGQVPEVTISIKSGNISGARAILTGYILDCSLAPCAPVAH